MVPTISEVAGSGGSTVSLGDSDTNHRLSMFYTTDGSIPAIFSVGGSAGTSRGLHEAPFLVPAGTTVRAISSWGQGANQGIVFPSFGYVPSNVVTVAVAGSARTLVGAYLEQPGEQEHHAGRGDAAVYRTWDLLQRHDGYLARFAGECSDGLEYQQPFGGKDQQPRPCDGRYGGNGKRSGHDRHS